MKWKQHKEDDVVGVYEDPITERKLEGAAIIVKCHADINGMAS